MSRATELVIRYIANDEQELGVIQADLAAGKSADEIAADWEENLDALSERIPPSFAPLWVDLMRSAFEEIDWDTVRDYFTPEDVDWVCGGCAAFYVDEKRVPERCPECGSADVRAVTEDGEAGE